MRIHTNTLTSTDLYDAARIARADLELTTHGSRKRARAFNVTLRGESRRRPNMGKYGAGDEYAATWDQWGVFLAELFDRDPSVFTPYDKDADFFDRRTAGRFGNGWPEDAHGDHTFRPDAPYVQKCTKCSATNSWRP